MLAKVPAIGILRSGQLLAGSNRILPAIRLLPLCENAMRTAFFLFCVAGIPASVAVVRALAEGDDNDLKQLQGKWVVVSAQFAGETDELAVGLRVEIAGKKITFKTGKTIGTEEFRLDPSKKPKAIDLLDSAKGKAKVAIYQLG